MTTNTIWNLNKFTQNLSPETAVDLLQTVLCEYELETFGDYSDFCFLLAQCARAMIVQEKHSKEQDFDEITFRNLEKLAKLLTDVSCLFTECDPYCR